MLLTPFGGLREALRKQERKIIEREGKTPEHTFQKGKSKKADSGLKVEKQTSSSAKKKRDSIRQKKESIKPSDSRKRRKKRKQKGSKRKKPLEPERINPEQEETNK